MAFGGRIAEQLIYGKDHLNTGASSDLQQATELARSMVTEWGMSEKLGPLRYNENQQEVFLGHSVTQRQNMSESWNSRRSTAKRLRRCCAARRSCAQRMMMDPSKPPARQFPPRVAGHARAGSRTLAAWSHNRNREHFSGRALAVMNDEGQ
jgi:hypothetical protein